jgi:hypothetical protein
MEEFQAELERKLAEGRNGEQVWLFIPRINFQLFPVSFYWMKLYTNYIFLN